MKTAHKSPFNVIVIVAALGYFVDIYDLILFSIVRVPSLKSMGLSPEEITNVGIRLMNWQMTGMLLGGFLWGFLGDTKGRVSVLFGSIILYSIANLLNGFVVNVSQYEWLRFIAGIGLAGELGAGITLVSETMTKERRGFGATLVVSIGVLGAILASYIGRNYEWNTAYFIGGGLGLMLLVLRIGVYESGMYQSIMKTNVSKGNFFYLFTDTDRFKRFLCCIALGFPIWYVIGILIFFSPEFAKIFLSQETIDAMAPGEFGKIAGNAVMFCYMGHAIGDFSCGIFSQIFKNRRKVVFTYMCITCIIIPIYLFQSNISLNFLFALCFILGAGSGFWVGFISIASEQFGTNIRATVTTTVPNFVRGSLVLMMALLNLFRENLNQNLVMSALYVGIIVMALSMIALLGLKETFGKDLNFVEGNSEQ
jgi:putative MFS transporter